MRKYKRKISLILIFCLIFTQMPAIAFAAVDEERHFSPSETTAVMEESTENTTTFDLGGGMKHITFHGSDVRFEDESGELTDYNPELIKVRDDESKQGNQLEDYTWKNRTGDSSQYFPDTLTNDIPILMEKDDYSIGMALQDDFSFNKAELRKEERETPYKSTETSDLTAVYESEDGSMSIEYTSLNQGVKETIVLEEEPESNVFTYSLSVKGLKAELSERKNIILLKDKKTDEIKAFLDRPFMHDASEEGAYSMDIQYGLTEDNENEGNYLLTLTVSEEYLQDEERVYPVSVDPTIVWAGSSMIEVVEVYSHAPDTRGSGVSSFFIECMGTAYTSAYMRFTDIEDTLTDKSISSAILTLYEGKEGTDEGEYQDIDVYRVTSSWNGSTISWNNQPSKAASAIAGTSGRGRIGARHRLDLTNLIAGYANGTYANHGIVFESLSEDTYVSTDFFGPGSSSTNRVTLDITYTEGEPTAPSSVSSYGSQYGVFSSTTYFKTGQPVYANWSGIESELLDCIEYKFVAKEGTDAPAAVGDEQVNLTEYRRLPGTGGSGTHVMIPYSDQLPDGSYNLHIRGIDTSGRAGDAESCVIFIDGGAPELTDLDIIQETEGVNKGTSVNAPTTDRTPEVTWTASDDRYLRKVSISVNGGEPVAGTYSEGTRSYTIPAAKFPDTGVYTITVSAEDIAGNVTSENLYYSLDLDAPVIESIEITPETSRGNRLDNVNPKVKWKVSDPFFDHIEYSVNGSSARVAGDASVGEITIPSDVWDGEDTYTLQFTAYDKAGNVSSTSYADYYLGSEGSFEPQAVTAEEYYGKRMISWTLEAFDQSSWQYDLHRGTSASFTPSSSTLVAENVDMTKGYFADNEILEAGTYYYKFVIKDTAGSSSDVTTDAVSVDSTVTAESFTNRTGFKDYLAYFEFGTPTGTGYIEKSSGNLMYQQTDYTVSNAQLDYGLDRTYNSRNTMTGMFGTGWSDSYHKELYKEGSNIHFVDSDGSVLTFTYEDGAYACAESREYTLEPDEDGDGYILTDKEDTAYTFKLNGQLETISEPNGCIIENMYDESGRLAYVVSRESFSTKVLEFTYQSDSRLLASVTDFAGTGYGYTYSGDKLTELEISKGTDSVSYGYGYNASSGLFDKVYDGENNCYNVAYTAEKADKVTYPNGEYYSLSFDTEKKETSVTKNNGLSGYENLPLYTETVKYDQSTGRMETSTDASGRVTEYSYTDANPYLIRQETAERYYQEITEDDTADLDQKVFVVTTYSYDSNENLTSEETVLKDSMTAEESTPVEETTYTYDAAVSGSENRVSSEQHTMGSETTEAYSYSYGELEENILTKSVNTEDPRQRGNIVSSYDAISAVMTNSTYDEVGRETSMTELQNEKPSDGAVLAAAEDEGVVISETETGYNAIVSEDGEFFTDQIQTETVSGDVVYASLSSYDGMGRAISEEADGEITSYTYDFLGRVIRTDRTLADGTVLTKTCSYNGNGSLVSETDERGVTTSYTYDSLNRRLSTQTSGEGIQSSQKWTSYGYTKDKEFLTGSGLAMGAGTVAYTETTTDQQSGGNVLSVTYTGGTGNILREETGTAYTCYSYDKSGNRILTYAGGTEEAELTLYDRDGRESDSIKNPAVSGSGFSIDSDSITEHTAYDAQGNISTVTDANGSVTEYAYDHEGRLTSCGEAGAKSTVSYTEISEASEYAVTRVTDANGNVKREFTDEAGLTVSTIDEDSTGSLAIKRDYIYNEDGNLVKEVYGDGSFIYSEYDRMNRLVRKSSYGSDLTEESVITYTYNAFGDMLTADTERNGSVVSAYVWTYDAGGNVLSESVSYGGEEAAVTTYAYDGEGRLTRTVYPESSGLGTLAYSYDYLGNVQEIRKDGQTVSKYTYDSRYRETAKKDYLTPGSEENYVEKTTAYNDFGRISSISYTSKVDGTSETVESYAYQYDDAGNITSRVRSRGSDDGTETRTYTYGGCYDALTATSITENGLTTDISYSYDAVGNRISMTEDGETTSYVYNGLNQLESKTDAEGTTSYTYDARGNQIQESGPDGTMNFSYLVTGELAEVSDANGIALQENEYNHEGIRIRREEGSVNRRYFHDQGSVAYTKDGSVLSTANVRSLDGEIIGSYRGSSYYLYTEDIQGSTGYIVDSSADIRNTYEYSDFGEVTLSGEAAIENEICYTGAVYDASTGLHYLNARYYDPENGRFISQDSYRGGLDEIQQWHLYVYCANNPINYTDPSGHLGWPNIISFKKGYVRKWVVEDLIDIGIAIVSPSSQAVFSIVDDYLKAKALEKFKNRKGKELREELRKSLKYYVKKTKSHSWKLYLSLYDRAGKLKQKKMKNKIKNFLNRSSVKRAFKVGLSTFVENNISRVARKISGLGIADIVDTFTSISGICTLLIDLYVDGDITDGKIRWK